VKHLQGGGENRHPRGKRNVPGQNSKKKGKGTHSTTAEKRKLQAKGKGDLAEERGRRDEKRGGAGTLFMREKEARFRKGGNQRGCGGSFSRERGCTEEEKPVYLRSSSPCEGKRMNRQRQAQKRKNFFGQQKRSGGRECPNRFEKKTRKNDREHREEKGGGQTPSIRKKKGEAKMVSQKGSFLRL